MNVAEISAFHSIPISELLENYDFGKRLSGKQANTLRSGCVVANLLTVWLFFVEDYKLYLSY